MKYHELVEGSFSTDEKQEGVFKRTPSFFYMFIWLRRACQAEAFLGSFCSSKKKRTKEKGRRKIEQATKQNIYFMCLSAMSYPDHNTINRFRSDRLNGVLKEIFKQEVLLLFENGIIILKEAYLDGTKIEATANRCTFVWRRFMHTRTPILPVNYLSDNGQRGHQH
jgi:hypothetical protein